jgi:hypothetical protein
MGCAQGKCCLSRHPRRGSAAVGGRDGTTLGRAAVPGAGLVLEYAALAVVGLYPDSPARESQDTHLVATRFAVDPDLHLFAVFDGHGVAGASCAGFARDALSRLLASLAAGPAAAFRDAMLAANAEMHAAPGVDDSMSGTTRAPSPVSGAPAGSSSRTSPGTRPVSRRRARVSKPVAPASCPSSRWRACTIPRTWLDAQRGDPPRVWARDALYPGTAFTRSLGDLTAEAVGVIAEPEVKSVEITPSHLFFVVASDGMFEFLSSQEVVDRVPALFSAPFSFLF